MQTIKPPRLHKGDTLGIIATSTPISKAGEESIQKGYAFLKEKGFKIVEAPNCRKESGHAAGTIKERVDALHRFFKDPKINGIIAFWGGFQSHQLLEYLDYELIRNNPKPLIGYSDVTALQTGINTKTRLVTFSGPGICTFFKPEQFQYTWDGFENVVMKGTAPLELKSSQTYSDTLWWKTEDKKMIVNKSDGWKTYNSGIAEGQIIGGNLGTMLLLENTQWWPDLKGKILFVEEDEDENPKTIDRLFTRLRHLKVFEQINGLVVGRFPTSCGFNKQDSFEMILDDALKEYKLPVLYNVDFGHTDPLFTIPIGVKCRIDAGKKQITYLESAVR